MSLNSSKIVVVRQRQQKDVDKDAFSNQKTAFCLVFSLALAAALTVALVVVVCHLYSSYQASYSSVVELSKVS